MSIRLGQNLPNYVLIVCEERLGQQYGNPLLQLLLGCCNASTPIYTFNRIYFFVVFFPIIWFAILSEAISSTCRTSRYPIVTILLSEVLLLTCLARYTAAIIILSTIIGGVALLVHPMTAGAKLAFLFINDCLSRLENYFTQRADSLQTLLEDNRTLIPMWIEDEWCEATDDSTGLSGYRSAAALATSILGKEKSKSQSPPPLVLPKVKFEVQQQTPKPNFDSEGWLLV